MIFANQPSESCFIFVIKTDCYAGNFERPMCAFMTGILGTCGVGDISAGLYTQQCSSDQGKHGNTWWEDKLVQVADDHGCHRPVSIGGDESHDVLIFFQERPSEEEIEFLRKRALLFILDTRDGVGRSGDDSHPIIRISGFELIQHNVETKQTLLGEYAPINILDV